MEPRRQNDEIDGFVESSSQVGPLTPFLLMRLCVPLPNHLDDAEEHQAKPKIHQNPEIEMRRGMARCRRQMRHEQEVHQVSRHNGDQRL